MIDTKKAKVRLLSLAFHGALIDFSEKGKQNEALDMLHKTAKNYSPVSEDEYLIDSPSFWKWSRLAYVTKNHGQTVPDKDFCYIDVGTLDNVHQRLAAEENHVSAKDAPSRARKIVRVGDVLYSTVRPYLHNICIVDREFSRMPIASTAFCVMQPNESVLLNKFLFYWLLTPEFDRYSNGDPSKGALYPAIGEKDLLRGVIPIPSIEEQSLIVEKIDGAFSALDTIDSLQAKYSDNLSALKAKLIDAAIQGKLTEQLPEDGTAEELYQQIQVEKQALIKEGKIKKERPLPEIRDEEIPFDIPQNWKWCRIGEIFSVGTGMTPLTSERKYYEKGQIPWVTSSLTSNRYIKYTDTFISEFALETTTLKLHPVHTLVIAMYGEGKTRGQISELLIPATTNQACATLDSIVYNQATVDFVYHFFTLNYERLRSKAAGSNQPNLNLGKIKETMIPLPPVKEQERIVERLECFISALGS